MSAHLKLLDFVKARREAGLSDETMLILLHVSTSGRAMSRDLAAGCGINVTTLPRYTSALVASGHLSKTPGTGDAREVFFGLSHHGVRLVERLLECFRP